MRRLLSILATLSVLAVAAPPFAAAQYDTPPPNQTPNQTQTGTTNDNNATENNATTTTSDETMPNTAGPLPLIAVIGAILLFSGVRGGLRRRIRE